MLKLPVGVTLGPTITAVKQVMRRW